MIDLPSLLFVAQHRRVVDHFSEHMGIGDVMLGTCRSSEHSSGMEACKSSTQSVSKGIRDEPCRSYIICRS